MLRRLKWKQARSVLLLAATPVGAMVGVAVGYSLSAWSWGGFDLWLMKRSGDAIAWGVLGAVAASALLYGAPRLSRPRTRGQAGAAPQRSRTRTHPPRNLEAANANGRLARAS
jgi:hypothetical protein